MNKISIENPFTIMKILIFICLIVIENQAASTGNNGGIDSRILNGEKAKRGQFPSIAKLLVANANTNSTGVYTGCGGSLIAPQWVVTAAHCTIGSTWAKLYLGMLNIYDNDVVTSYVSKSGIFVHPDYSPTRSPSPDIALFKLNEPVPLDKYSYVRVVSVPNVGKNSVSRYDNAVATAAGWGNTGYGQGSNDLLFANVNVMPSADCIKNFSPGATKATICTEKKRKNAGPCEGDSGGPLYINTTKGQELIGVVSYGAAFGSSICRDKNGVVVYEYVPYHRDWILKVMASN